ncbi:F-box/kelch-repeat protein At3g06240-like isoform X2 [Silene latifolia]|uniref:F-box/kelch-repeat protein At3g06240-like isoform X2 n=1 Tax=Silene latifolia TaxID=37657 RepID=UPI003D777DEB
MPTSPMTPIFPPEIEAEILLRLPAKSLQRFKSVCKSWRFLISSDALFSASFYRRSDQNPQLLFLKHPPNSLKTPIHFSIASIQSNSIVETTTLPLPNNVVSPLLIPTKVELINSNSVNGIVGIVVYLGFYNGPSDVRCESYIWNPSTSESVKLPNSEVSGLFNGPPMVKFYSGFGVGSGIENVGLDYKVVRVVYTGSGNAMCEVYSIRGNCWKKLPFGLANSSNTLWASEMCTFVDGVGYWGVYKRERKDNFSVLGFDFSKERFKNIKVPEVCVDGGERKFHSLWEYRGDLALSVLHFGGFETGSSRIYIWVFTQRGGLCEDFEQCWSTVFNIDLECGPRRPVVSLDSREVVLLGEDDDEHVLYDSVNGHVKMVSVCDVDHVVVYVESLVSLRSLLPKEDRSSTDLIDSLNDEEGIMCSMSSRLPSPHAGGRSASW